MDMLIMFLFQSCLCSSFPILSTRGRSIISINFPMFKELYLSKICFIYTLTIINLWIYKSIYPLVNSHITMENHTMLSMGKSTMSMTIFNSKLLVYQRVLPKLWPIVSWGYYCQYMESHKSHVPNHQPDIYPLVNIQKTMEHHHV